MNKQAMHRVITAFEQVTQYEGIDISAYGDKAAKVWNELCAAIAAMNEFMGDGIKADTPSPTSCRGTDCAVCDEARAKSSAKAGEIPDNALVPLMTACAHEFDVDALGMGNLDRLAKDMLTVLRPYLCTRAPEMSPDATRYEIVQRAIADCFPNSADRGGIYHLDSGNLQGLGQTAIEIYERSRLKRESSEDEHLDSCECCQKFALMERRYDHLRGFPQDEHVFKHICAANTSGWQPIETAPKNRVQIVAIVQPNPRKWWHHIIHFEPPNPEDRSSSGRWYEGPMPLHGKPTHWMPIPNSNGIEDQAGGK